MTEQGRVDVMSIRFDIFPGVEAVDRDVWNRLASDAAPFMEWEYFRALEVSGSVSPERGYRPMHLVAYSGDRPVALAPLYLRDRAWVEFGDGGLLEFLSETTGLPFNVGLVGTIPFTPVPGYEIASGSNGDGPEIVGNLLGYMDYLCETRGLSTSRVYFVDSTENGFQDRLMEHGYLRFRSKHCLWVNKGYTDFDDYLQSFRTSRRTKIRRELKSVREAGITVRMVEGANAPAEYYRTMYRLYLRTWLRHMGPGVRPFLTQGFFDLLEQQYRHRSSFSVAEREGEIVAMALFYHKSGTLYGRYWGCFEETPFLHFAVCYYHPIDHCIRNGFQVMDPGFGGRHKLLRGYDVVPVDHYIKFHQEEQRRIADTVIRQMSSVDEDDDDDF